MGEETRKGNDEKRTGGALRLSLVTDDRELVGMVSFLEEVGMRPSKEETLKAALKAGYTDMVLAWAEENHRADEKKVAAMDRLLEAFGR